MKTKLKGYVLMESMMAMVVVMICFGIAVMIINNLVVGSGEQMKVTARIRLEQEANMIKKEKRFLDETISSEDFQIQKQFQPWRNSECIYEMELTAIRHDGKILARYYELFRKI